MGHEKILRSLARNGYKVTYCETSVEATTYITDSITAMTVGFGDSATLASLNLANLLAKNNTVIDPRLCSELEFVEKAKEAVLTDVFLTSVNAASETGELVNIDGTGNRVAGSLFGHKKVFFIFGTNKIEPTLEKAMWRARNIAAPQNAKRFGYNTPCATKGDRCYDCASPQRICNSIIIHLKKMNAIEAEVVIINENLRM